VSRFASLLSARGAKFVVALAFAFAGSALGPAFALAVNIPVTTTADSGAGSLRSAIDSANVTPGVDSISFSIGSGPQTIRPTTPLSVITDPVVIDATGQPGFAGVPLIGLDGTSAGAGVTGLEITAGSSTVRGLAVTGWNNRGIELSGAGSSVIAGNYVGTDGSNALPNAAAGIIVDAGSVNNTIGGTIPADRNLVSGGASRGITLSGANTTGNVIEGNFIGTNAAGTAAVPNQLDGILIVNSANGNLTGGTSPGAANLISGNILAGVDVTAATQNTIQGNLIGTDAAGTKPLPNQKGVGLGGGAPGNFVGGTTAAARNVISGNSDRGIVIGASGSNSNLVQGNLIGLDDARNPLPNGEGGVLVFNNAVGNVIGGAAPGAGNTIAYNADTTEPGATLKGGEGVIIDGAASKGTSVLANSIFSNANKVGIDLARGGNGSQAPPLVTSIRSARKSTTISGTAPAGARVEVFSNPSCGDPEAKAFLGAAQASRDGWSLRVPRLGKGKGVTATDTPASTSNTSSLSSCRSAGATFRCAGRKATIVGSPAKDLLRGTKRRDVIAALGGKDVVRGLGGNDVICGGPGNDKLFGGPGKDRILGQGGKDRLFGGPGKDKLRGGPGRDKMHR
jgi:RTX calcium-binding nonapeptide repeat (4 copies)